MINQDKFIIGIPVLIIVILSLYFFFKPPQYENQPISGMDYSHLDSSTPEEIEDKLVKSQEKFVGSIDYKYLNGEKTLADIHMFNDYTGDDSTTATDYIYTAEKDGSIWKIIEIKKRWKCRDRIFWTTSICS